MDLFLILDPSWYWMPDVFEKFFGDFGKKVSDYYKLERLDPGYQVYFGRKRLNIDRRFSWKRSIQLLKLKKKEVLLN